MHATGQQYGHGLSNFVHSHTTAAEGGTGNPVSSTLHCIFSGGVYVAGALEPGSIPPSQWQGPGRLQGAEIPLWQWQRGGTL